MGYPVVNSVVTLGVALRRVWPVALQSKVVIVTEVASNGPAEAAGVMFGDRIVRIDEKAADFENDLQVVLELMRRTSGDKLELALARGVEELVVTLTAIAMPSEQQEDLIQWVRTARRRVNQGKEIYCKRPDSLSNGPDPVAALAASLTQVEEFSLRVTKLTDGRFEISADPADLQLPENIEPRHVLESTTEFERMLEGASITVRFEKLAGNQWRISRTSTPK